MSVKIVENVEECLSKANDNWPRDSWFDADKQAKTLTQRIARVLGDSAVEFALAWVEGERRNDDAVFRAAIFTTEAVIYGSAAAGGNGAYPPNGDVTIVPRTALHALVLNHVHNFEDEHSQTQTYFTATYEGLTEPLVVDRRMPGYQQDGQAGRLFDALRTDLLRKAAGAA